MIPQVRLPQVHQYVGWHQGVFRSVSESLYHPIHRRMGIQLYTGSPQKTETKHVTTAAMGMTARGNRSVNADTPQHGFDQLVSFA
jgi:hypothetical protein